MASKLNLMNENGKVLSIESGSIKSDKLLEPGDFKYIRDTVSSLGAINNPLDGDVCFIKGYHTNNDNAGGTFIYRVDKAKSEHNGGIIIDPDKTFPNVWSNVDELNNWYRVKNTGTGCWVRINYSYITPDIFGAKGDNLTDDTYAVQTMFDSLTLNSKPIKLNNKTYCLTSKINIGDVPLTIIGDNILESKFKWLNTSTSQGLHISNKYFVHIENISLTTLLKELDTALTIDKSNEITSDSHIQNRTTPRVLLNNVHIAGDTATNTDGWLNGINLYSTLHCVIENYTFEGYYDIDQTNIKSSTAILVNGPGDPVEIIIKNSWAFFVNKAIFTEDVEGVYIDKCNLVAVNTGVYVNNTGLQPQVNISNSHINAYKNNIILNSSAQSKIDGNLLYKRDGSLENSSGIVFYNTGTTIITNNTFINNSTQNFDGIVLQGLSSNNNIISNAFNNVGTCTWIQSSYCKNNYINNDNSYVNITNKYIDSGTETKISNDECTIVLTSDKTITNNTDTALSFDKVFVGNSRYFDINSPTKLTIPTSGYYSISACIVYVTNSTGYRKVTFKLNGLVRRGLSSLTINANGTIEDYLNISSSSIYLNEGDYIELYTDQNSGGDLNIMAESETYMTIKYIGN